MLYCCIIVAINIGHVYMVIIHVGSSEIAQYLLTKHTFWDKAICLATSAAFVVLAVATALHS